MRGLLPVMLIGLGIYVVRGYIFKPKAEADHMVTSRTPGELCIDAIAL